MGLTRNVGTKFMITPEMRLAKVENPIICINPCFDSSWPLRSSTEISAIEFLDGAVGESIVR